MQEQHLAARQAVREAHVALRVLQYGVQYEVHGGIGQVIGKRDASMGKMQHRRTPLHLDPALHVRLPVRELRHR
eukprot:3845078-Pyramimonas_sp.AAC.1